MKPQPMRAALKDLGTQTGVQILFRVEDIAREGNTTPPVSGQLSVQEALDRLLANTGLKYEFVNERTVRVAKAAEAAPPPAEKANVTGQESSSAAGEESGPHIEEVLVTAQKRIERLQEVPVPVAVVGAEKLVENNQARLQDYYQTIPGLNLAPGGTGQAQQLLTIRGITTGTGNPTVGITVDDAPFGSSTFVGGGVVVPDIDPADLARVEVLRGPQGTLYGAASMGGLLKFVTVDPSMDQWSGRVQVGATSVRNGDGPGYNVRGSMNIPLSDTLAVHASAFTRQDAGYIDDPVRNIEGVDETRVSGGRLSGMWRPSDIFSVKLSALFQETKGDGTSDVTPGLGDLEQSHLPGTGQRDRKVQSYTANVHASLGQAEFTSISGYSVNEWSQTDDAAALAGFTSLFFPSSTATYVSANQTQKFTQEVRLSLPVGQKFDWLLGGYYTHENSPYTQDLRAVVPATGADLGSVFLTAFPSAYREYAAFTDVTIHFSDRFDVQVGARESRIREVSKPKTQSGALFAGDVVRTSETHLNDRAFTYLLTPRLRLTPAVMIYARLASGYRPGVGVGNPSPSEDCFARNYPCSAGPDQTYNYELGVKADLFDDVLSLDASLYYINWKDIQVTVQRADAVSFVTNGGGARSRGAEVSVESRPAPGLTLLAWAVFNDAELTDDFVDPNGGDARAGDRLPLSSRFSAYLAASQDFPLTNGVTGFAGADVSYVGERENGFIQHLTLPSYTKLDLRAGAKFEDWTVNVFLNNATDRRGILQYGRVINDGGIYYIPPRTLGLSLSRVF
jgi:outer membrane receptor protein involved in Fe transport